MTRTTRLVHVIAASGTTPGARGMGPPGRIMPDIVAALKPRAQAFELSAGESKSVDVKKNALARPPSI
ncbi:MAG TPA: hypothetical protein VES67_00985 [Vicinamibacterales bacterium]|nr:hypothetical protein [Vicinamibacterales bacterium]